MLKKTLSIFTLAMFVLPGANAEEWKDGKEFRVYTNINKPFVPDTTGAVTINNGQSDGFPQVGNTIFDLSVKIPEGVGSFKLTPENIRNIGGGYHVADLSQTKDGNKYVLNYYLEKFGGHGPNYIIKMDNSISGNSGDTFNFRGIYHPTNLRADTSKYPWGTYSGSIKVTYFSR